jgi:putative spermidine/putrescine transport system substrate-binding protein
MNTYLKSTTALLLGLTIAGQGMAQTMATEVGAGEGQVNIVA